MRLRVNRIDCAGPRERHDPPRPLDAPNREAPLADGDVLVTEIGGWVDRFDRTGRLVYSIRTPTDCPLSRSPTPAFSSRASTRPAALTS